MLAARRLAAALLLVIGGLLPLTPMAHAQDTDTTTETVDEALAATAANGLRREVWGYYPYWAVGRSNVLDWATLSDAVYFGVDGKADGSLVTSGAKWSAWRSDAMKGAIDGAHAAGRRLHLGVIAMAWSSASATAQRTLLGSEANRAALIANTVGQMRDRGADGISLDMEPITDKPGFVSLLRAYRAALDAAGATDGRSYRLTYAAMATPDASPVTDAVAAGVDAVIIMGYDYRIGSSPSAGSTDPRRGSVYDLTDTIGAYRRLAPANRIVLALPLYGRSYAAASDQPGARTLDPATYGSSGAPTIDIAYSLAAQYGRRADREGGSYVVYATASCAPPACYRQTYYDAPDELLTRIRLVDRAGLRGVGFWALGYEGSVASTVRELIARGVGTKDAEGPEAGVVLLPPTSADGGLRLRARGYDPGGSGILRYEAQTSLDGGAWIDAGSFAPADELLIPASGALAVRVRGTDAAGNVGDWSRETPAAVGVPAALAIGRYATVVTTTPLRSGPSRTTGYTAGSVPAGSTVRLVARTLAGSEYWWMTTGTLRADRDPTYPGVTEGYLPESVLTVTADPGATLIRPAITAVTVATDPAFPLAPAGLPAFSPDGDGVADALVVRYLLAAPAESVEVRMVGPDGTTVRTGSVSPGVAAGEWRFDGLTDAGTPAPEGDYRVVLAARSGATTAWWPVADPPPATILKVAARARLDRTAPPPPPLATPAPVRPGVGGTLANAALPAGAYAAELTLVDPSGATVAEAKGLPRIGLTWDATLADTTSGERVPAPDGSYVLTLRVRDGAGVASAPTTRTLLVDGTKPTIAQSAPAYFGAPTRLAATIRVTANEPVTVRTRITNAAGATVRYLDGTSVAWNGRNAKGYLVPSGTYTLTSVATDRAGNVTSAKRTIAYLPAVASLTATRTIVAGSKASVRLVLRSAASVSIAVRPSGGGSATKLLAARTLAGGTRTLTVPTDSLAAGDYEWLIRVGAGTVVLRLSVSTP